MRSITARVEKLEELTDIHKEPNFIILTIYNMTDDDVIGFKMRDKAYPRLEGC